MRTKKAKITPEQKAEDKKDRKAFSQMIRMLKRRGALIESDKGPPPEHWLINDKPGGGK